MDPQETTKKLGAEIIRLWVAASDYSGDIAGDDKILARVVDAYRRIRNTLRFLLANVSDFDPARDAVPPGRDAGDRPLRAGARRAVPGRGAGPLRGLRVPSRGRQAAGLLLRGPGRVLPGHPEGPALHHGAEIAGPPQRPDRAVEHHARDAALDGALPQLHRRGSVEAVRRLRIDLLRDLCRDRRPRSGLAGEMDAHPRRARDGQQGDRDPARSGQGRFVAAGERGADGADGRAWRAVGGAGEPGRRPQVRLHHFGDGAGGRRCHGGEGVAVGSREVRALLALARRRGRTMRRIPRSAAAAPAICSAPAKQRVFA